jgi:hypothetical protein
MKCVDVFLDEVVTRLQIMFPDGNIMEVFAAINETQNDRGMIAHQKKMYRTPKKLNRIDHPSLIDEISTIQEYNLIQPLTRKYRVNCERGISRYNAIKTDSRSALQVTAVEQLVFLNIEAPSYKKFPYDEAFQVWKAAKDRRKLDKMSKGHD